MKRTIMYLFGWIMLLTTAASCKKEDTSSGLKAVFSYVTDGYKVNFTNFSSNAKEYMWDFGDGSGQTSSSKAPQHIFTKKGDYLVSLTAKNGNETNTFIDTVSVIGPNIKIDGDYSDWQYVEFAHTNADGYASSIRAIKTFASSQEINFYIEGTADMNMAIIDLYIDADNNPATGFSTWMYPAGSGADFLCEGSPVGGWGDVFAHNGEPAAFSWAPVTSFADAIYFSQLTTSGGKNAIEFSIKKSALAGANNRFVNFCIIESTSGWAEVGKIPEAGGSAKFIAIPL
jgi:PKD repeat protein